MSREAWESVLTQFEADLDAVLLATRSGDPAAEQRARAPWTPPAEIGDLPPDLVRRAGAVASAQQAVLSYLYDARDAAARQLNAVRKVPAARDEGASAFIDARA